MLSKEDQIKSQFLSDLKDHITDFFNSKTTYQNKYILNSDVVKGSVFENKELCTLDPRFSFNLPIDKIRLGDIEMMNLDLMVKVAAAVDEIRRKDGELILHTYADFTISPNIHMEYDSENEKIVINKIDIV